MTRSSDATFLEALETELNRRNPVESPFGSLTASNAPLPPGSFPTPAADIAMYPRLADELTRQREAQLARITQTGFAQYEFHYDVFVVHRHPSGCFECKIKTKEVFDAKAAALAEGGNPNDVEEGFDFHHCPHNDRKQYVDLMNRGLRKEIVVSAHREETLQSGAVQVCVSWGEPVRRTKNTPPREPRT